MNTDYSVAVDTNGSTSSMPAGVTARQTSGDEHSFFTSKMFDGLLVGLTRFLPAVSRKTARSCLLAHDEAAFRLLLANELKRSERSGRSFHVLLAYISGPEKQALPMDGKVTSTLVPILSGVLRETDHIGWYRYGHVLGGVLTALGDHSKEEVFSRVEQRFWWRIREEYPLREFARLRIRFFHGQDLQRIDRVDRISALS